MRTHLCLIPVLIVCKTSPLHAQYDEPSKYESPVARYVHFGIMQRDFQPRSSNTAPDSAVISYDRWMPMIGLHQGMFDISFGYAQFSLRGKSRSTIFFGVMASNEILLTGSRQGALILPIMLSADFTKAEGLRSEREDFNIASVGIGGGLKFRFNQESVDFSIHATQFVQYSFEGFSSGNGFSAATVAEVSMLINRALVFDGMALGYRFRFQTWSMSNENFDYRVVAHGPYVGILF